MSNWLAPIRRILDADTGDLRRLAEIVGADPTIFYVGRDLSKCDLRGQDLRGMNLTGAVLDPRLMDENTKIDPEFDPRFVATEYYVQIGLREEVLAIALAFADYAKYRYKAWAIKALLERGIMSLSYDSEIKEMIGSNERLYELSLPKKGKMRRITVNVYAYIQESLSKVKYGQGQRPDRDSYNEVVLAGALTYVSTEDIRNSANFEPMDMFKGAQFYLGEILRGKRFIR